MQRECVDDTQDISECCWKFYFIEDGQQRNAEYVLFGKLEILFSGYLRT